MESGGSDNDTFHQQSSDWLSLSDQPTSLDHKAYKVRRITEPSAELSPSLPLNVLCPWGVDVLTCHWAYMMENVYQLGCVNRSPVHQFHLDLPMQLMDRDGSLLSEYQIT